MAPQIKKLTKGVPTLRTVSVRVFQQFEKLPINTSKFNRDGTNIVVEEPPTTMEKEVGSTSCQGNAASLSNN